MQQLNLSVIVTRTSTSPFHHAAKSITTTSSMAKGMRAHGSASNTQSQNMWGGEEAIRFNLNQRRNGKEARPRGIQKSGCISYRSPLLE